MISFLASAHRDFIVRAMETLMYAVGTPIPGSNNRSPCVYFRPKTFNDQYFVRITHGDGCSGSVRIPSIILKTYRFDFVSNLGRFLAK